MAKRCQNFLHCYPYIISNNNSRTRNKNYLRFFESFKNFNKCSCLVDFIGTSGELYLVFKAPNYKTTY